MTLFGAIVAVGLGPAMWLGAQFGDVTLTPQRPPAVTVQQNEPVQPRGGTGAGDGPADQTRIIRSEPKAVTEPLRTRPRPAPTSSSPSPDPSPSEEPTSTEPTESTPPADEESEEPSTPPTESTTEPTTPSAEDGDDEPSLPEAQPEPETEKA
ncbi:hypothetical protein Asp14428_32170 [Actinoplanes sp. NBRC 14428]|nr:hypothetical protein [Pseudosporangium ferrugineum]BCJ51742.1 hypothetical protein Asp14428_32170 [Actinoplanes sp. NBRC 14428]